MSEEEKEAIKTLADLKERKFYTHAFDNGTLVLDDDEIESIDMVLNLIEKLQKETELLKQNYSVAIEQNKTYKANIYNLKEENFKIKHLMRNPCDIPIAIVDNTIERLEKALTKVEQMPSCATRYDTIQRLSNQIEILEELKESEGDR